MMQAGSGFALLCGILLFVTQIWPGDAFQALSGWQNGRSTFYGPNDGHGGTPGSLDIGSCGFGYIQRHSMPFGFVGAPVRSNHLDMYSGNCGACYEVRCTGTPIAGHGSPCFSGDNSVVVQVVDSCPCYQSGNEQSNKRWCCGDMPHIDLSTEAFQILAPLWIGAIYMQYRAVTCDFYSGIVVYIDEASTNYWLGVRFLFIGNYGALLYVEGKTVGGNWKAMSKGWGATWVMQNYKPFGLPISLRITTARTKRSITFWNIIPHVKPGWGFWTNVNFAISGWSNSGAIGSFRRRSLLEASKSPGCVQLARDAFNCTGIPAWAATEDHITASLLQSNSSTAFVPDDEDGVLSAASDPSSMGAAIGNATTTNKTGLSPHNLVSNRRHMLGADPSDVTPTAGLILPAITIQVPDPLQTAPLANEPPFLHQSIFADGLMDPWYDSSFGGQYNFDSPGGLAGGPALTMKLNPGPLAALALSTTIPVQGPGGAALWVRSADPAACPIKPASLAIILEGIDPQTDVTGQITAAANALRCAFGALPLASSVDLARRAQALADRCSPAALPDPTQDNGAYASAWALSPVTIPASDSLLVRTWEASANGSMADASPGAAFSTAMSTETAAMGCGGSYCPALGRSRLELCLFYPSPNAVTVPPPLASPPPDCSAASTARRQIEFPLLLTGQSAMAVTDAPDADPYIQLAAKIGGDPAAALWDRLLIHDLSHSGCPFAIDDLTLDAFVPPPPA